MLHVWIWGTWSFVWGAKPTKAPVATGLGLCSDPQLCLWICQTNKECCQKSKRQRWDICGEFSVWHFVTKCTGLKSVKPAMSSHFPESRDTSYISSAMCPECPRKEWRTKPFGLQSTPTGKRPRVRWCKSRWRDYIYDLTWSRLGVEPAELSEIAVDREVFRVLLGLLPPRLSPKESLAGKWVNEWVCRSTEPFYLWNCL